MLFEVTADDIKLLGDSDLRELVARLSEQEVRQQGHSPVGVTWGGHQNAADGGIDVRVSLPVGEAISGYVPAAATGFQVKAQDMPRQAILDEMAPGGVLRESIAGLSAARGAYIIVSSQGSVADIALTDRENAMRDALNGRVPAGSLTVKFYDRTRIATWVNLHPGQIPWVREKIGRPMSGWRPFKDWSSSPAPLDAPYLLDDGVRLVGPSEQGRDGLSAIDGVNSIRRILEKPKGIVRLVGLSGVGKTRLVQALFDRRIGADPLAQIEAVYTDISERPDPVPLELATRLLQLKQRAVLIIDNCGPDLHQKLVSRIAESDGLLSLITVEYDINDDEPENTNVFKLDVASVELMEKILAERFADIPEPSRRTIAEFSGGNSRIAFALAATAKNGDSLVDLKDRELFERLFHQSKGKDKELLNAAKACALLYSFDGDTHEGDEAELPLLAGLIGLTGIHLFAHVADLHRRQLVQKRSKWRAILPHAIAHRLAKLALEDIPFPRIEDALVNGGSERVLRSFSKRIGYLHDNEHAVVLVSKWFGKAGLLEPLGKYNELGKTLFTNVAPIDQELTLAFIERASASKNWFFGPENQNKHEIVRVLRSLAYEGALFERAATLIRGFAMAEGNVNYDSSKEVLKSLFYLYLSGTLATPAQRAAFIKPLLESNDQAEGDFGLELLRAMLECSHFTSHYPFDFGARSRNYGYNPRNRTGIMDWFHQAMQLCADVGTSSHRTAPAIKTMFATNLSQLCVRVGMIDEIISIADALAGGGSWPEGWVGFRAALKRLKDKGLEGDTLKIESAIGRFKPVDLADTVRSYALSKDWGPLDIAELEEDEESSPVKARERVLMFCTELGQQLAEDRSKLVGLLPEIFSQHSQKTFWLGKGIARGCESVSECWVLLRKTFVSLPKAARNTTLLGGFIEEAMRQNSAEVESILDATFADSCMHDAALYLQSNAEMAGNAFPRLIQGLDVETMPVISYTQIAFGRVHRGLSDDQVSELARKVQTKEEGVDVAVEIIGMRMFSPQKEAPPLSETIKAAGRDILRNIHFKHKSPHFDHMLGVIIGSSLDRPEHEDVARQVCRRIQEGLDAYTISASDVGDVVEHLAKVMPMAVLDILVGRGNDESRSAFMEFRGSRGCALQKVPDATLMSWASAKPNERYPALAQAVRYSDANDEDSTRTWSSTAEQIINNAPDPATVLNIFVERFRPMSGWSGALANVMATRMPLLQSLLTHQRPEVIAWAKEKIPAFAKSVEALRTSEAERDRDRDERFE